MNQVLHYASTVFKKKKNKPASKDSIMRFAATIQSASERIEVPDYSCSDTPEAKPRTVK